MATVTRQTGLQATVGTMYSPNCNVYLFTIKTGDSRGPSTAIDLRAEDDAVNETVEQIIKEFNPAAYFITDDASGKIHMVLDKSQNDRSELEIQLRRIGDSNDDGSTVGPNLIDISGSTVAAAASFTVA
jgi:hypothetical protein